MRPFPTIISPDFYYVWRYALQKFTLLCPITVSTDDAEV